MSSSPSRRSQCGVLPVLCVALVVAVLVDCPSGAQTTDERILWCREYVGGIDVPVVGPNGTMCARWLYGGGKSFYLIAPDGIPMMRIEVPTHYSLSEPIIGDRGTIYIMSSTSLGIVEGGDQGMIISYLHAYSPAGDELWRTELLPEGRAWSSAIPRMLAMAGNGDILASTYANGDGGLYDVSPEGVLRWRFMTPYDILDMGVGPDGTLYAIASAGVYAIDPAGQLKWYWPSGRSLGSGLAIDGSGSIYCFTSSSTSLSPAALCVVGADGQLQGMGSCEDSPWVHFPPVIDSEGSILFLEHAGGSMTRPISILHAVTRTGEPYWRFPLVSNGWSSVIVGADGTVYLLGQEGERKLLYALDVLGGRERWGIEFTNQINGFTMSEAGVIYLVQSYGGYVNYLYAIQTDSPGLADSPWPMPRHDPRNTGRVSGPATAVLEISSERLPTACRLGSSYPNPFNAGTVIPFELPVASPAEVRVYDLLGQEVALLAKGWFTAGRHQVRWEPQGQGSAVYLCRLTTINSASVQRLVLIR